MNNKELSTFIDDEWGVQISHDDLKLTHYIEGYCYGYLDDPVSVFIPQSIVEHLKDSKLFKSFEKLILIPISDADDLKIAQSSVKVETYKNILNDYLKNNLGEMVYQYILDYNFYVKEIYDKIKIKE